MSVAADPLPSALRVGDAAVWFLAVWTVCANAAVFAGLGLDALIGSFALASAALWFARRRLARTSSARPPHEAATSAVEEVGPPRIPDTRWRVACVLVALCAVALLHGSGDPRPFWLVSVALLTATLVRERHPETVATAASESADRWLWALAFAGALLASTAHRPDSDDAFYLNLAVAAATHPELPLLAADTLHGIDGLPLALPVYRLHSLELLWAALARVLGFRVLDLAHVVTPALAGALLPLALARLLRLLLPARWMWALAIALGFLLLAGGPIHSFGNFGFVRLHQGKAILVSVALPLLAAFAIEYGRSPTRAAWWRLAAAQVAALGLSASAAWLAPAVAGLALLGAVPFDRRALRRIGLGALASLYPLAAGAGIRNATRDLFEAGAQRGEFPLLPDYELAHSAILPVLGSDAMVSGLLAVLLVAGSVAATPACRRFCAVFALGFLLFFWNPFAANQVAASATGPGTYWRVFWLLPLPVFVGATLTAPFLSSGVRDTRFANAALGAVLALALLAWAPSWPVVSRANGVSWARPGWRLPPDARPMLDAVRERTAPGTAVLLPLDVAPWIVVFEEAPSPLVVRPDYLGVLRARYDTTELDRRMRLAAIVSGQARSLRADDVLRKAIADYELVAVGLAGSARSGTPIDDALVGAGLERVFDDAHYTLWTRPEQR